MIHEHAESFGGLKAIDFDPDAGIGDPSRTAYRLRVDWDQHSEGVTGASLLDRLLASDGASAITALIIGDWGGVGEGNPADEIVEALVSNRDRLPRLAALFIGDIIGEESEISWIQQTDLSPIWSAFPSLHHLRVRGGTGLQLGHPAHGELRSLVIESGGLPQRVAHELATARLPELTHLELWLGSPGYGGDIGVEDLGFIFTGERFAKLRYLGLRNSEITDGIAAALAGAGVLDRIETLDLSLGVLTDEGAAALAANPAIRRLRKLDIHHHYLSDEAVASLGKLGIPIDASDPQEADEYNGEIYRNIYVAE